MSNNNKNVEYGWSSWFRRATNSLGSRNSLENKQPREENDKEILVRYGITNQLQEFVKGFTLDTFKENQQDHDGGVGGPENAPLVGNIRQDLTKWQVKHANLMLANVKEISQLRYVLCPRHMKERQFWHIYFKLVKHHVQQPFICQLEQILERGVGEFAFTMICDIQNMLVGGCTCT
ncbi:unnamed protein product [Victoria cruziana]